MDAITTSLHRIRNSAIPAIFVLLLGACNSNTFYSVYNDLPAAGWNKNSASVFQVNITDNSQPYNVLINVRHESNYPYQNFWMFVSEKSPEGTVTRDTIECFLADNRGKWLGSGLSSIYTMPVLINKNRKFTRAGTYTFEIKQGMRDDILTGIRNIGLEIDKPE
jgi:gliding motility-associated lipoprotein GldH